ncbi:hypothetical protein N0M98_33845 [Paenibacillus doosanensis]|nr:hypothetical protein [Paenibacillus doosanensis]
MQGQKSMGGVSVGKITEGKFVIWFSLVSAAVAERVVKAINQNNSRSDRSYIVVYNYR